jgi:hypothetical protein
MAALGYKEWENGFRNDNLPKTLLDTHYFLELGRCSSDGYHEGHTMVRCPIKVELFRMPGRDLKSIRDKVIENADAFIVSATAAANRLNYHEGLKNILFDGLEVEQLAESNDNGCIATMEFVALVVISNE